MKTNAGGMLMAKLDSQSAPISLAQQLIWVAHCVSQVHLGQSLQTLMPQVPSALRPGVQALVFHALRHWGTCHSLSQLLVDRAPAPMPKALLTSALSLLLPDLPAHAPRYEAFTTVDQAVASARLHPKTTRSAAWVNACLRRFLRESSSLLPQAQTDWQATWNHPTWWIKRLRRDHPQHWQAILQQSHQPAPMALRVNVLQQSQSAYLHRLSQAGMVAHAQGSVGVVLQQAVPVDALPGFDEGACSVQDFAGQMAAPLLLGGWALPANRAIRVLDACAAPGGKTGHLIEHLLHQGAQVDVLALEVDAHRSQRIHDNLTRLRLMAHAACSVQIKVADALQPQTWWPNEQPFDLVLLDAPCTASGIVRRHPDVAWLRRESDVQTLEQTQQRMLHTLWPMVAAGGRLLYCTCSLFAAEGRQQATAFEAQHPSAQALSSPGHLLPQAWPVQDSHDGFFYALYQKHPPQ